MSGYAYGPPPPPPSTKAPQGYGHAPHQSHGRGGGGHHRGRGGHHGGRGGHHHHDGQPAYPYSRPGYAQQQQHGPSFPGPQPPPNAYNGPPPQGWHDPSRGPPPHTHAPAPIVTSNYHPNYAPQPYTQSQYPPQQGYAQPPPYSPPYQAQPPPHSQWSGRGSYPDRGRGGSYNPRGGRYDHDPPPQGGAYAQPYAHDPRAGQYPPQAYLYQGPPPPPSAHQDAYFGQPPRRGRGGHRGNDRGRGGHASGNKDRFNKPNQHVNPHKTATQDSPPAGKKKKRKTNTLGLTPGVDSESEDDEEEEKVLSELIGDDVLNVSDIAAYLAERKKHYPTKARVATRKAEQEAEAQLPKPNKSEDKASLLEKQAEKLRKQLRKVESSIKRKREQGDEGDEMRDSSSEESSDDERPEEASSRTEAAATAAAVPPPPARRADVSKHCKYYSTGGMCGKKGKCRFVHDPEIRQAAMKEREANNGRMTIQQRLILNDKDQEDLTILQSIQYLREKGVIDAAALKRQEEEESKLDQASKPAKRSSGSTLPAPPASLPQPPPKRDYEAHSQPSSSTIPSADTSDTKGVKHYQGWLLRPYGSTNGKSTKSENAPHA